MQGSRAISQAILLVFPLCEQKTTCGSTVKSVNLSIYERMGSPATGQALMETWDEGICPLECNQK